MFTVSKVRKMWFCSAAEVTDSKKRGNQFDDKSCHCGHTKQNKEHRQWPVLVCITENRSENSVSLKSFAE
jgi:hypothetical protein